VQVTSLKHATPHNPDTNIHTNGQSGDWYGDVTSSLIRWRHLSER